MNQRWNTASLLSAIIGGGLSMLALTLSGAGLGVLATGGIVLMGAAIAGAAGDSYFNRPAPSGITQHTHHQTRPYAASAAASASAEPPGDMAAALATAKSDKPFTADHQNLPNLKNNNKDVQIG